MDQMNLKIIRVIAIQYTTAVSMLMRLFSKNQLNVGSNINVITMRDHTNTVIVIVKQIVMWY